MNNRTKLKTTDGSIIFVDCEERLANLVKWKVNKNGRPIPSIKNSHPK